MAAVNFLSYRESGNSYVLSKKQKGRMSPAGHKNSAFCLSTSEVTILGKRWLYERENINSRRSVRHPHSIE
jgi:hypothetical protein